MSVKGGIVALNGFGMPETWPHRKYRLSVTRGGAVVETQVIGTQPGKMLIKLPGADGAQYTITIDPPHGNSIQTTVTPKDTSTPLLTLATATPTTPGTNSFTFTKTNLFASDPVYVEIYSLYNNQEIHNATSVSITGKTVAFSADLPGGKFMFRFFYPDHGYADCTDTVSIIISQPTIAPLIASYNGG